MLAVNNLQDMEQEARALPAQESFWGKYKVTILIGIGAVALTTVFLLTLPPVAILGLVGAGCLASLLGLGIRCCLIACRRQGSQPSEEEEDAELAEALRLSLAEDAELAEAPHLSPAEEAELAAALRLSLEPLEQEPEAKSVAPIYYCAFDQLSYSPEDLTPVPEERLVEIGPHKYDIVNLVKSLLSLPGEWVQGEYILRKDVFGNPISQEDLELTALRMGLDPREFQNIWRRARRDQDSEQPMFDTWGEPLLDEVGRPREDNHAELKIDARNRFFKQMLQEQTGDPAIDALRQKYLLLFRD